MLAIIRSSPTAGTPWTISLDPALHFLRPIQHHVNLVAAGDLWLTAENLCVHRGRQPRARSFSFPLFSFRNAFSSSACSRSLIHCS